MAAVLVSLEKTEEAAAFQGTPAAFFKGLRYVFSHAGPEFSRKSLQEGPVNLCGEIEALGAGILGHSSSSSLCSGDERRFPGSGKQLSHPEGFFPRNAPTE